MAFQTSVATNPSPGIEGGFAGVNPNFSLITPDEGMWIAGAVGPVIGRFAWANTANGKVTSAHPGVATVRVGFLHRDQPVVANATMLSGLSMQVVAGAPVDLAEDGTFWARFTSGATIGQKVYMSYADGSVRAGATATPATATGVTVSMNNSTTITAVAGGTLVPGQPISGTGIPAGAYVVSVNAGAATAVISAATTGGSATGVAVTQTTDFETAFTVRSTAGNGELAKISVRG